MTAELVLGIVGTIGGLFALYVRLTLSDLIIKVLDKRYPSADTFAATIGALNASIRALPCQTGHLCHFAKEDK